MGHLLKVAGLADSTPWSLKHRELVKGFYAEWLCTLTVSETDLFPSLKSRALQLLSKIDNDSKWRSVDRIYTQGSNKHLLLGIKSRPEGRKIWCNPDNLWMTESEYDQICGKPCLAFFENDGGIVKFRKSTQYLHPNPIDLLVEEADGSLRSITHDEVCEVMDRLSQTLEVASAIEPKPSTPRPSNRPAIVSLGDEAYRMICDHLKSVHRDEISRAHIVQYSCGRCKEIVGHLMRLGATVNLYIVDPDSCTNQHQIDRINMTLNGHVNDWMAEAEHSKSGATLQVFTYPEHLAGPRIVLIKKHIASFGSYFHDQRIDHSTIIGHRCQTTSGWYGSSDYDTIQEVSRDFILSLHWRSTKTGSKVINKRFPPTETVEPLSEDNPAQVKGF